MAGTDHRRLAAGGLRARAGRRSRRELRAAGRRARRAAWRRRRYAPRRPALAAGRYACPTPRQRPHAFTSTAPTARPSWRSAGDRARPPPGGQPGGGRRRTHLLTYSGARGEQVPVSIFRINPDGTRESFVTGLVNPTAMIVRSRRPLYVSSRFEGVVYAWTVPASSRPRCRMSASPAALRSVRTGHSSSAIDRARSSASGPTARRR